MDDSYLPLFIDTNCFLQMKDFNQIKWRALFPNAEEIALFVCQAVISELDRHKVSTNRRRKDRARSALQRIEQAADSPGMSLPIRAQSPKVDLVLWPGTPVWADFPNLDPKSADDYLVAAASSGLGDGIVFSHDTGPRIRARIAGVRAVCPHDEWLLAPEQTDDQRQIAQLKRELDESKNARPKLQIILPVDDPMTISMWSVPPLGTTLADRLTEIIMRELPEQHVSVRPQSMHSLLHDPLAITQSQVDAYHQDYVAFVSDLKTYFVTLHEKIGRHAKAQLPSGAIVNAGNVSAKNITLEVAVKGDIELLADRQDAESVLGSIALPKAPSPPRPRAAAYFAEPLMRGQQQPRNPTRFYWTERPELIGSTEASLECKDFRPGREECLFALLHGRGRPPISGKMTVTVSAEHHEIVSADKDVVFEPAFGSWLHSDIQVMLPDLVREAFQKVDPSLISKW